MIKINLLNHGGYHGLLGVTFPVEVEGHTDDDGFSFEIPSSELIRIGGEPKQFSTVGLLSDTWLFLESSAEIVK